MAWMNGPTPPEPTSIWPASIASRITGPEVSWRHSISTPGSRFSSVFCSRMTMSCR